MSFYENSPDLFLIMPWRRTSSRPRQPQVPPGPGEAAGHLPRLRKNHRHMDYVISSVRLSCAKAADRRQPGEMVDCAKVPPSCWSSAWPPSAAAQSLPIPGRRARPAGGRLGREREGIKAVGRDNVAPSLRLLPIFVSPLSLSVATPPHGRVRVAVSVRALSPQSPIFFVTGSPVP